VFKGVTEEGTPHFLVVAKGETLWEALPDDWKAAKEVELVKLLVSEYGGREFRGSVMR
jgi:hypothetical protein